MEVRPGYKPTDIGLLPGDWEASTIGDVATFSGGSQPPRSTFKFAPASGYVRLVQIRDYKTDDFATYIPELLARKRCTAQDIMIGRYGPPVFQILRGIEGAYNVALIKTTPTQRIDREFYFNVLKQESLLQLIDALSRRSSGQTGVEMSALKSFGVALPPMTEQRAIAAALSDIDALLAGLDRLIAKKRDLKQAAMQQLLTGQIRLPGFRGEWEVKRLGDHVRFLKNGVNSRAELAANGSTKYLHYGDIHVASGVALDPSALPCLSEEKARSLDRLADGDLVFVDASEDMDGVGKAVEIFGASHTALVAGLHTIAARFDPSILAKGFKAYLQFCPPFRQHLRRLAAGTKVYATNRRHIATVEMPLPSPEEQTAIATVLSDMDAELVALEARRDKTRALKRGMMQELLTGRTRLV
jgi:type I restriction enzyme S subunit